MAFALQKRCSTTELSRRTKHRKHPQGEFQSIATSRFGEGSTDVGLNGAWTQHKATGDVTVGEAFEQQGGDATFRSGE